MPEITAELVRELREKSGAGMMDCKKALEATGGDFEGAFDHLRKQGLKTAEKKAGRATGEGRVYAVVSDDQRSGAMVNVSCETDFVAKTPDFEAFLDALCRAALEHSPADVAELTGKPWKQGGTVDDALKALVGRLGENIQVAAVARFENSEGRVGAYVHHDMKKAALASVTTGADTDTARETLRDLCMHVVVFRPGALDREAVPRDRLERERAIYREEVKDKPDDIRERILGGKLEKFFAETVLTEQPWIRDDKLSVKSAVERALGTGTRIEAYARFQVGEA